jgi:hypothetical protein
MREPREDLVYPRDGGIGAAGEPQRGIERASDRTSGGVLVARGRHRRGQSGRTVQ